MVKDKDTLKQLYRQLNTTNTIIKIEDKFNSFTLKIPLSSFSQENLRWIHKTLNIFSWKILPKEDHLLLYLSINREEKEEGHTG